MPYLTNIRAEDTAVVRAREASRVTGIQIFVRKHPMPGSRPGSSDWCLFIPVLPRDLSAWWVEWNRLQDEEAAAARST
jgi:hypothetical protein